MRAISTRCSGAATALFCMLFLTVNSVAKTVQVPSQHADLLSALMDSTLTHGDTILVAPGIYTGPGNRDLEYNGKDLVMLSTGGAVATIIDVQGTAMQGHRGVLFAPGQFGATTRAAVLDGFTIRNGFLGTPVEPEKAALAELPPRRDRLAHDLSGAGLMFRLGASATVRNCIIENCFSEYTGGGIGVEFSSNPRFENVTVRGCRADILGGGVTVETLGLGEFVDCVITGNSARSSGGGISISENTTMQGCVIADNGSRRGGGIDVSFPASLSVQNCIIWNNCASDSGAQMYVNPAINPSGFVRLTCSAIDTLGIRDLGGVLEFQQSNVFENPQFCDAAGCSEAPTSAGHYTLREGSPCLPAGNACNQLIGPNPNACSTLVDKRSISQVKSLFR